MPGEEVVCVLFYGIFCGLCCCPPIDNSNKKSTILTSAVEPGIPPKNNDIKFKNYEHVTVNKIFKR